MEQYIVFATIIISLILFIDGRIRYDFVALGSLIFLTILKIHNPQTAFVAFGHPAVVTVVSVLVISKSLIKTGAMEQIVSKVNSSISSTSLKILSLMVITAVLSSFMNNVGALALVMPVAITISKNKNISPSVLLMPVAFASLLGGMTTEIGTPPNLIVSMYRAQAGYSAFSFFDFAPVGIILLFLGVIYTVTVGWRFIPLRKGSTKKDDLFKLEDYISEVIVTHNCNMIGSNLSDFKNKHSIELNVLSIIRSGKKIIAPMANERLIENDLLVIKADHSELAKLLKTTKMILKHTKKHALAPQIEDKENHTVLEVVLKNDSPLINKNAVEISLRNTYNINLLAISRKGTPSIYRLKDYRFKAGDIMLIQVPNKTIGDIFQSLKLVPLANRELNIQKNYKENHRLITIALFATAIILTTLNLLPVQVSFSSTAVLLVVLGILSPKEFYDSIEWPAVMMLGSLLPLGAALQSTGGADTIASILINFTNYFPDNFMLVILMMMTLVMTNLINNSAAAVLMAPIAISLALNMGVSIDPMLMGVCVASSSAFLTPIGHQSNLLIMGPGGYQFGDYWRLGLPITIIILVVGSPLILYFWPM